MAGTAHQRMLEVRCLAGLVATGLYAEPSHLSGIISGYHTVYAEPEVASA
jgi:hypothetical protein